LLSLAWPVVLSYLVQYLFEMVDMVWVGFLPNAEVPLAALTLATYISWMLNSAMQLIAVGVTTLVARSVGAGARGRARRVAGSALAFGVPVAVLITAVGLFSIDPLLRYLGVDRAVEVEARRYLRVLFCGAGLTYWVMIFDAVQRGAGDTVTPLKIGALAFGLNALLDPLLIFGLGAFPGLGLEGAAVASLTARATAVLIYAVRARRDRLAIPLGDAAFRFALRHIASCSRIGAPIAAVGVLFMVVYMELTRIAAMFGADAVAAFGVGVRIEGITFICMEALAVATQTMVGQNLGAGLPQRAWRTAWTAVAWGAGFGLVVMTVLLAIPEALVGLLASNGSEAMLQQAARYCRIEAVPQLFMTWEVVLTGAFAGVGYTLPPMLTSVPLNLSRIPLAHALIPVVSVGSDAVFFAIAVTCILRGAVAILWFRFGPWRRHYLVKRASRPDETAESVSGEPGPALERI
jgi:putative MATE family efflux protein